MGASLACAECGHDTSEVSVPQERNYNPTLVRPMLTNFESDLANFADSNGSVDPDQLWKVWQACAQKAVGELSEEDFKEMEKNLKAFQSSRATDDLSRVSYKEFAGFLLDSIKDAAQGDAAIARLEDFVAEDPVAFHELLRNLSDRHSEADGTISVTEFLTCMATLLDACGESVDFQDLKVETLVRDAKMKGVEQVSLVEAVALLLNRCAEPVELLLYDISNGASRFLSPVLLGRQFEAIYHSSVLVFGLEYWYGGKLFENTPPLDASVFGPPLVQSAVPLQVSRYSQDLRVVRLGHTLSTRRELRTFLKRKMKKKYRRDNYDIMENNCNCFTDDVARFLTGRGIPAEVRRLPELIMGTPAAQLLRPLLNTWLRGFQCEADEDKEDSDHESISWPRSVCYSSGQASARTEPQVLDDNAGDVLSDTHDFGIVKDEGVNISPCGLPTCCPSARTVIVPSPSVPEQFPSEALSLIVTTDDSDQFGACQVDLGVFDPTTKSNIVRRNSKHSAVKRLNNGNLVRAKSGDAVEAGSPDEALISERKAVRREAVKMLADGQLVRARLV